MESNYYGIYAILASLPIWATILIFYLLTLFVVDAGREKFEGFSYNVSHTARYGDVGLLIIVIIGAEILKRGQNFTGFLAIKELQVVYLMLFVLFFVSMLRVEQIMCNKGVKRQIVDIYHNLFIAPFIACLLLANLPVIIYHGTTMEKWVTVICYFFWAALFRYDFKHKRLDQRSWLKAHGYTCILKN